MDQPRPGRPPTGQTPKRYARVGPLWDRLAARAATRGETMTALLVRALKREEARLDREERRAQAIPWLEQP